MTSIAYIKIDNSRIPYRVTGKAVKKFLSFLGVKVFYTVESMRFKY